SMLNVWLQCCTGTQRDRAMISRHVRSLVLSFVLLLAGPAFAQELSLRSFPVPQHGALKLQVPKAWKDRVSQVSQPPGSPAPVIELTSGGQEAFEVRLSPIWRTWPAAPQAASADLKRQVEQSADRIKPEAVEKELAIQEIRGASGAGYYFSATSP